MDWTPILTTVISLLAGVYIFYQLTEKKIDKLDEQIKLIDSNHREDLKVINDRWIKMDEKWERLFERFLIQDKK